MPSWTVLIVVVVLGAMLGALVARAVSPRAAVALPCPRPHMPRVEPVLAARALALVATEAEDAAAHGELKRHRVYARLLKEFPGTPKRTIAFAIEAALAD